MYVWCDRRCSVCGILCCKLDASGCLVERGIGLYLHMRWLHGSFARVVRCTSSKWLAGRFVFNEIFNRIAFFTWTFLA